jgi:ribosomal protein S27AE
MKNFLSLIYDLFLGLIATIVYGITFTKLPKRCGECQFLASPELDSCPQCGESLIFEEQEDI